MTRRRGRLQPRKRFAHVTSEPLERRFVLSGISIAPTLSSHVHPPHVETHGHHVLPKSGPGDGLMNPPITFSTLTPDGSPGPTGITPAQMRHAYAIDQVRFQSGTILGNGSG